MTGPYAADYDIDKIMQHAQDKIINAAAKTADPVLMGHCTIKPSATEGIGLCPGQKFGDAVELNRKQRGLEPFKSDEERKERYNEISNALKNDSPEVAEERMKEKKDLRLFIICGIFQTLLFPGLHGQRGAQRR